MRRSDRGGNIEDRDEDVREDDFLEPDEFLVRSHDRGNKVRCVNLNAAHAAFGEINACVVCGRVK